MNIKKWLIVLCVLLCLLLGLTACGQKIEAVKMLAPPVEGLEWGMTMAETMSALTEKGLPQSEIVCEDPAGGAAQILLGGAQCQNLGMNPVAEENTIAAVLFFAKDTEGEAYLAYAYVDVSEDDQKGLAEELTKLYGKPAGENFWIAGDFSVRFSNSGEQSCVTVEYHAEKYVKANFGKFQIT